MSRKRDIAQISTVGSHILVVDDERAITEMLQKILEREGYVTQAAATGRQAIDALSKQDYELMIVDKNLPDINGIEITIRARARRPDMEVIIITGYASYESAVEALRLGVFDYIEKPFNDIGIMLEKIRRALEKHRILYENRVLASHLREAYTDIAGIREKLDSSIDDMGKVNSYLDEMIKWATMEIKDENSVLKQTISRTTHQLSRLQEHLENFSDQFEEMPPEFLEAKNIVRRAYMTISAAPPAPTTRISTVQQENEKQEPDS